MSLMYNIPFVHPNWSFPQLAGLIIEDTTAVSGCSFFRTGGRSFDTCTFVPADWVMSPSADLRETVRQVARLDKSLVSVEMLQRARAAIEALKAREGEDVEEWARHLANDITEAHD